LADRMAHGGARLAPGDARARPRLRPGALVDLPPPRVRRAGLGDRPLVRRVRESPAHPRCRCRSGRLPHPSRAEARALPFANEFFDAVVSIDSFFYYGTDDLYANYLARFLKPGGAIGIAGAGMMKEFDGTIPEHLRAWWEPSMACLHTAEWWRRHWERSGLLDVALADAMPDGWRRWLDWQYAIAPDNAVELRALEADAGANLGYVRAVAHSRTGAKPDEPVTSVPTTYEPKPLLRGLG
jgi:SAM-dependent methyltransferase